MSGMLVALRWNGRHLSRQELLDKAAGAANKVAAAFDHVDQLDIGALLADEAQQYVQLQIITSASQSDLARMRAMLNQEFAKGGGKAEPHGKRSPVGVLMTRDRMRMASLVAGVLGTILFVIGGCNEVLKRDRGFDPDPPVPPIPFGETLRAPIRPANLPNELVDRTPKSVIVPGEQHLTADFGTVGALGGLWCGRNARLKLKETEVSGTVVGGDESPESWPNKLSTETSVERVPVTARFTFHVGEEDLHRELHYEARLDVDCAVKGGLLSYEPQTRELECGGVLFVATSEEVAVAGQYRMESESYGTKLAAAQSYNSSLDAYNQSVEARNRELSAGTPLWTLCRLAGAMAIIGSLALSVAARTFWLVVPLTGCASVTFALIAALFIVLTTIGLATTDWQRRLEPLPDTRIVIETPTGEKEVASNKRDEVALDTKAGLPAPEPGTTDAPLPEPANESMLKPSVTADDYRIWTDVTGKYTVEAAFVERANGRVRLRRRDGSEIQVDLNVLSEQDRNLATGRR